ncbi:MAG: SIS domain-containing protein [Planctomycetes bacterium]|nr:SIS domain-containing protein [Planctomycetota bacterium]
MCGIVGLLRAFDPAARVDVSSLGPTLGQVEAFDPEADDAGDALHTIASGVESLSRELVGWGGLHTLRSDAAAALAVRELAGALLHAAEAIDERLTAARNVRDSNHGEALARGSVLARDIAWRLEQDALRNLDAVNDLTREVEGPSTKLVFELWRLNLILNQLERLEVRGRDSGGLGTLISFAPQAVAEAEAGIAPLRADLEARLLRAPLLDGAVLRSAGEDGGLSLAFAHKVAKEVGELGANVRDLRARVRADRLLLSLLGQAGAQVQLIAHTRWASNGVISEPNCHPVANDLRTSPQPETIVLGVLNGDIDNYASLAPAFAIPATCTTDAKIVPLEVARHYALGSGDPEARMAEAFRAASSAFHGSTAIGVISSADPARVHLSQRGSGQAVYVGLLPGGGFLFASELYGIVELCAEYYKLDGERGEAITLSSSGGVEAIERFCFDDLKLNPVKASELKRAPIATRDIDRAGFPHYLLKEISEAPRSIERTLRGKFQLDPQPRFLFGDDVIPPALRVLLTERRLREVYVIGQGTANVAGESAADFMTTLLRPAGIEVRGMPATELSGFYLGQLGPQSLVIAVSQSGTTTDTNRTVDLARQQGALVIGIVNRRGSDLADKSHGVLYTSDGRDVEMSVASTKAFYCQVVAGYLLALQLAHLAGTLSEADLREHLLRLRDLPRCMREVLDTSRERIRQGAALAVRRQHWTLVGSGPGRFAAREIRIKLSELCYKSVPVDTIEDKKHIDLSSEPMLLVCAGGLSGPAAADAVKEVAIFRAHAGAPVVICDRSETRFAEYALATIPIPSSSPEVALLLNTIAGHLFSYETALLIERASAPLRQAREVCEAALEALSGQAATVDPSSLRQRLRTALDHPARAILDALREGQFNAALEAADAFALTYELGATLTTLRGQVPLQVLARHLAQLVTQLTAAIDELRRPIDAIKHQAKTVTVGISREATSRPVAGKLEEALLAAGVEAATIQDADAAALAALDAAVDEVTGVVHYRLDELDPLGGPTDATRIMVLNKTGVASGIVSRADSGAPLAGTKRGIVRSPCVWVGLGRRDGRPLLACPLYRDGLLAELGLVHLKVKRELPLRERVRALRATGRHEDLRCIVTENDVAWSDSLLEQFEPLELLTGSIEELSSRLVRGATTRSSARDTQAVDSPFLTLRRGEGPA